MDLQSVRVKNERFSRKVLGAFVFTVVAYIALYSFIENRRTHNGPWQLTFTANGYNEPALVINQPKLGITNVTFVFPNQTFSRTNLASVTFTQPIGTPFELPFGQCIFMDLTSLPGTLVFQISGHEIQLLPRTLTVDKQEQPWEAGERFSLPEQKTTP